LKISSSVGKLGSMGQLADSGRMGQLADSGSMGQLADVRKHEPIGRSQVALVNLQISGSMGRLADLIYYTVDSEWQTTDVESKTENKTR
jgi:hypothetical protein